MKQRIVKGIFATISLFAVVGIVAGMPAEAAENYRFKMWIAPIECTRNEVSDGVTTTIILTPEQCDDYLHPPVKPQPGKPVKPNPSAPNAPDTGRFSDIWTNIGMVTILSIFGASILTLIIRDKKQLKRNNLQKKRR
ncbi:MAG TPA: hypothetical protein VGE13_02195 [Candidatus Saccharimonadales bacterium]